MVNVVQNLGFKTLVPPPAGGSGAAL